MGFILVLAMLFKAKIFGSSITLVEPNALKFVKKRLQAKFAHMLARKRPLS